MPSSHQRSAARVRPSGSEALATSPYLIPVYEGHLLSSWGLAADQLGSLPGCRACAVSPLSHRYLTSAAEHGTSAIAALPTSQHARHHAPGSSPKMPNARIASALSTEAPISNSDAAA